MINEPNKILPYQQVGYANDFVFPLIRTTKRSDGTYNPGTLIGTAFFIGSRGYALTAGHVIDQLYLDLPSDGVIISLFPDGKVYHAFEITDKCKHPDTDVGILKVNGDSWRSRVNVNIVPHHASTEYQCWGYPRLIAQEITHIIKGAIEMPELIFTQGYIRRRIDRELRCIMYTGKQFYELSEVVGEGNSGGPVILKTPNMLWYQWQLMGVYIGEHQNGEKIDISYAVRCEAFMNWKPDILDRSILEEANPPPPPPRKRGPKTDQSDGDSQ